jgi:hypothetical protein
VLTGKPVVPVVMAISNDFTAATPLFRATVKLLLARIAKRK